MTTTQEILVLLAVAAGAFAGAPDVQTVDTTKSVLIGHRKAGPDRKAAILVRAVDTKDEAALVLPADPVKLRKLQFILVPRTGLTGLTAFHVFTSEAKGYDRFENVAGVGAQRFDRTLPAQISPLWAKDEPAEIEDGCGEEPAEAVPPRLAGFRIVGTRASSSETEPGGIDQAKKEGAGGTDDDTKEPDAPLEHAGIVFEIPPRAPANRIYGLRCIPVWRQADRKLAGFEMSLVALPKPEAK